MQTTSRRDEAVVGPRAVLPVRWDDVPDEELVTASIDGSREAFDELASRYRAAAVRTAAYVVGRERAEDVVQDALILAFRAIRMINDRSKFPAWLAAITRFRALRLGRTEGRKHAGCVSLDGPILETLRAIEPEPELDDRSEEQLVRCLARLPEAYSTVLRLHFLDGQPHQRIAERVGATLSTVKWRCFRGKALMRELLAEDEAAAGAGRFVDAACACCRRGPGGDLGDAFEAGPGPRPLPACSRRTEHGVQRTARPRPARPR